MPITRRALLISNPGEARDENHCLGVYVDIKNHQRFLASAEGGGWAPSEIEPPMDRPSTAELRLKIAELARYDYTFIMFTGHGWYSSSTRDRILILGNGEEIPSKELLKYAKKRVLILDCCQQVHQESYIEKLGRMVSFATEATIPRRPSMEACRKLFLQQIENAPAGVVQAFSCNIDEFANDDDDVGGLYNSSLIKSAESWILERANDHRKSDSILTIGSAHAQAAETTRAKSKYSQNPQIESSPVNSIYPFSVFA